MITILTDKMVDDLGQNMYREIEKARQDIKHFCVGNMRVEPCYACRGCEEKTYKRCVIRDDADLILPFLVRSETIVIFTSIVFGGYSFPVKRVVDRFNLLARVHYDFRDGELKSGKYSGVNYYVIGLQDSPHTEEIKVFKQLVFETIDIIGWKGRPFVLPHDADEYDNLIQKVASL